MYVNLWHIPSIYKAYTKNMSGMSQAHLSYVLGKAYLRNLSGKSYAYLMHIFRYISGKSSANTRKMSVIFQAYLWHNSGYPKKIISISQAYLRYRSVISQANISQILVKSQSKPQHFLNLFSRLSQNFLNTLSSISQHFPTFSELSW